MPSGLGPCQRFNRSDKAAFQKAFKPLAATIGKLCNDSEAVVRDAALRILAAAQLSLGEPAVAPYLGKLDKKLLDKFRGFLKDVPSARGRMRRGCCSSLTTHAHTTPTPTGMHTASVCTVTYTICLIQDTDATSFGFTEASHCNNCASLRPQQRCIREFLHHPLHEWGGARAGDAARTAKVRQREAHPREPQPEQRGSGLTPKR